MPVRGTITLTSGTYTNYTKKFISTDVVLTGNIAFEGNTSIYVERGNLSTRNANVSVGNAYWCILATDNFLDMGKIDGGTANVVLWSNNFLPNVGGVYISNYNEDGTIYVQSNSSVFIYNSGPNYSYETTAPGTVAPYRVPRLNRASSTSKFATYSPLGGLTLSGSDAYGRFLFRSLNTTGTSVILVLTNGGQSEDSRTASWFSNAYSILSWSETVYGPINISSIQTEFGGSNPLGLSEYYAGGSYVGAGTVGYPYGVSTVIPSTGPISLNNFYGAQNKFVASISSNISDVNLRNWAISNGWNQTSPVEITINSGVYVYSSTTGGYALTINGSWPGGITLKNNGTILGKGGTGGSGGSNGGTGGNGTAGGPGLSVSTPTVIWNYGIIAGGGGGGGGGNSVSDSMTKGVYYGGGGGGGGLGNGSGGSGGSGNIFGSSGTDGSLTLVGSGGAGAPSAYGGAAGGTYGSSGGNAFQGGGGAGGASISGNSNITWIVNGYRYGTIT